MREITISIRIDASPKRVWQVLVDFDRWVEWTESIRKIEVLDAGPPSVGSRFRIVQPRLRPAVWAVTEWKPEKSFTWELRSPGIHVTAEHVIEAMQSGCEVTLRVRYGGLLASVVAALAGKLTAQYMALEAAGLKQRSETAP